MGIRWEQVYNWNQLEKFERQPGKLTLNFCEVKCKIINCASSVNDYRIL